MSIDFSRTLPPGIRGCFFIAALAGSSTPFAQAFPAVIDLASPETVGTRFDCSFPMESCGRIVADAGDFNDDGFGGPDRALFVTECDGVFSYGFE